MNTPRRRRSGLLDAAPLLLVVTCLFGCAAMTGNSTEFKQWRGDKVYKGDGGSVTVVEGVEFWEIGEPDKPYKVIGVISQAKPDDAINDLLFGQYNKKAIVDEVKRARGNGVVLLKSDKFVSGYSTNSQTSHVSANYSEASVMAVFQYVEH